LSLTGGLVDAQANRTIGCMSKPWLIRSKVHLLFGHSSLKERSCSSSTAIKIVRTISRVALFDHWLLLRSRLCNSDLVYGRNSCMWVIEVDFRNELFLILHNWLGRLCGHDLCLCLRSWSWGTLANLVIVLIPIVCLLTVDHIGVLDCNLLILLLDGLLPGHLLCSWPHLLVWNLLLLLRWTLISITVITMVSFTVVEKTLKCFDKLCFLVLDFTLECIAREVYIFSLLALFCGAFFFLIFLGIERVFLLEVVKARAVFVVLNRWDKWRFLAPQVLPVEASKEWMILNFLNAIDTQTVFSVAQKALKNISCLRREVWLLWNVEGLFPMENLLTCNAGLVREEWRVSYHHFEENGACRPPIYGFAITLLAKYFRRNIVRSTNRWKSKLPISDVFSPSIGLNLAHIRVLTGGLLDNVWKVTAHLLLYVGAFGLNFHMLT